LALGSWLLALGSWLLALGSWLLALGSWLLALGSWLLALGNADAIVGAQGCFVRRYPYSYCCLLALQVQSSVGHGPAIDEIRKKANSKRVPLYDRDFGSESYADKSAPPQPQNRPAGDPGVRATQSHTIKRRLGDLTGKLSFTVQYFRHGEPRVTMKLTFQQLFPGRVANRHNPSGPRRLFASWACFCRNESR